VTTLDPEASSFKTIQLGDHKAVAANDLVMLMRMRRSCRSYKNKPLDIEVLEDLAKIGASCPSGTNSQRWNFYILKDRDSVMRLSVAIARFFKLLNRVAKNPAARMISRLTPGDQLGMYYREGYDSVLEALREWDEEGKDRLFHGAPAGIIISSSPGATCPKEDALLAAGQIVLAAQAMGLGTCLIGFVVEAMKSDPRIKRELGIAKTQKFMQSSQSVTRRSTTRDRQAGFTSPSAFYRSSPCTKSKP